MHTCSRCGEEIRHGTRGLVTGWLHRTEVDHAPSHGRLVMPEDVAHWEAENVRPRTRVSRAAAKRCPTYQRLWPLETYITAEEDILRDDDTSRRARRLAIFRGEDPDYVEPIPEPEVPCHPVDVDSFAPRSGIRQIVNVVLRQDDWELVRLTHSRGPYVGSAGTVLSISDAVVMGARGPRVDGSRRVAVASWRDGKFDFAYIGTIKGGQLTPQAANTEALKAWIKDTT